MIERKNAPIDKQVRNLMVSYEMAADICGWLSDGHSLTSWLKKDHRPKYGMQPNTTMVYRWRQQQDWFRDMYDDAKENRADTLADEIIEIADEANNDVYMATDSKGNTVAKIDGSAINRARLRVDARKWVASVLKPRAYGQKVDVTSKGDHVADSKKSRDKDAAAAKVKKLIDEARARINGDAASQSVDPFS